MNRKPEPAPRRARLLQAAPILLAIFMLVCTLSGCAALSSVLGGKSLVPEGATTADLRGKDIDEEQFASLLTCTQLVQLDLRISQAGDVAPITVAQYEKLHAALPNCEILWSVPFGDVSFDSTASEITLPNVDAGVIQAVRYFPNLARVDATACTCYDALLSLQQDLPDCTFLWNVQVGDQTVASDATTLDLSGTDVTAEQLGAALPYLPKLTGVDLHNTGVSGEKLATLGTAYPDIRFDADLDVCGKSVDTAATHLDLSDAPSYDADTLISMLPFFPAAETVDLAGQDVSLADMDKLSAAFPSLQFAWELTLCGVKVSASDTELDLSGQSIDDLDDFAGKLKYLPSLTRVDLCNSNLTDEQLGSLSEQYPNITFVWYVTVGRWQIRTDAVAFSTGNERNTETVTYLKKGITNLTTEDIAPLKYCKNLVALDIGHHRRIKDISVITNLPKLRFLIVAMVGISDVNAIASCTELEYLETFQNNLTDLTPLLALKKLKCLNCSTNAIGNIDVLKQMTQLERLWCIRCGFDNAQISELEAALPECVINTTGTHSTSNGWRKNDLYKEMQKLFGLPALD